MRIPLSARTILQVGYVSSSLSAAYRGMNPKARVLGINIDAAEGTLAACQANTDVGEDRTADVLPFDVPDSIDCIIYNDVLEHLSDPGACLQRHAKALAADGMMLVCVRNIEYWRLTDRLLRGGRHDGETATGHAVQPSGFTAEAMRQNFTNAGLTVCDVTPIEPDADAAARFAAMLAPGLQALGINPLDYATRVSASHLIWRVRKAPRKRMIVCGSMLDPVGGVSHMRVVYPLQAIATDPTVTACVTDRVDDDAPSDDMPRIFVLHRPTLFGHQGHQILHRLTNAGFLIVTEFDDLPSHFQMMRLGGELAFYGVHAVQTSTTAMAEELRRYNTEIAVFPNAAAVLPETSNFTDMNVMTMFFGALNRENDWLPFIPAINAVAALAGERLKFKVVHDQTFFDALETPYKSFTPTCDHETYLRMLGNSEISFMPLSDTQFNRAKSDLKFIEAGSCRVAALASSVVYGDSIQDGHTGILFRDPVQFHARLLRLVAMPEMARDLADAAREYIANERMLAYQVSPRIAWYRSLWARRAELIRARQQRMSQYGINA